MRLTLKVVRMIHLISAYAPTAPSLEDGKNRFYTKLHEVFNEIKNTGIPLVLGDFNARVQASLDEDCIGQHTFDKENNHVHRQDADVATDWDMFITFLTRTKQIALSTTLYKQPHILITYKEKKAHPGGPHIREKTMRSWTT